MNRTFSVSVVAGATSVLAASGVAHGAMLDQQQVALVVESTISDLDVGVVGSVLGDGIDSDFSYSSFYTPTGWQGFMSGFHNGHSVSIGYTGTVTSVGGTDNAFSVDYTSSWNVDGMMGGGSGSAYYSEVAGRDGSGERTSTGASVTITPSTTGVGISVGYGQFPFSMNVQRDNTTGLITATGSVDNALIPLIGGPSLAGIDATVTYNPTTGAYSSVFRGRALFNLFSTTLATNSGFAAPLPGGGGGNNQVIHTPTPSAAVLAACGGVCALRRRRN